MKGLRIGLGIDSHRLEAERPCRLGGVEIDSPVGPVGHSDGDAVLHAVCDAVLGAAGLDDLGTMFSNRDPANAARDSAEFCEKAHRLITDAGCTLLSIDIVIETEQPKISPHRAAMRERIATLFGLGGDQVNLRGKTGEKVGEIGRGELLRVTAIALLARG